MLIVNSEDINLADDDGHYALLLERVREGVIGKQYFNPMLR